MKTVIALIAFSDGELSMFKGEIRDIETERAAQLIRDGYVAEYSGAGGGVLVVHEVETGETLLTGTLPNVDGYAWRSVAQGQGEEAHFVDFACDLDGVQYDTLTCVIDGESFRTTYENGTVSVAVGYMGKTQLNTWGFESEASVAGKAITLVADAVVRLDKTWQEVVDAGFAVIHSVDGEVFRVYILVLYGTEGSAYALSFYDYLSGNIKAFTTSSANGYPTLSEE